MTKETEFNDSLLPTNEKKRMTKYEHGIRYLNGMRYRMTGESVSVAIPDNANYIKIYAEHDDIRIGINARASADSPMIAFGGIGPEIIDNITNLETMALYGTANQFCSISFFRRDV